MLGGNIKTLPDVKSMIRPNSRKFQTNFSSCPKLRQVYAGMTRLSIGIRMKLVADSAISCRTVGVFVQRKKKWVCWKKCLHPLRQAEFSD